MKKAGFVIAIASLISVGACATRPLPENITNLNTFQIVQKIRCEARDVVHDQIHQLLVGSGKLQLANELRSGTGRSYRQTFQDEFQNLDKRVKANIAEYYNVAIAFDFTFDITEHNDLTASTDFLDIMTGGMLKLGISADKKIQRRNLRNFQIIDPFSDLVFDDSSNDYCDANAANLDTSYPITGKLNLEKTFIPYFDLAENTNLQGSGDSTKFADTLEFTTTLRGSVNPTIDLGTAATNIKLDVATLGVELKRVDRHQLIISLAAPDPDADPDDLITPETPEARTDAQKNRAEATKQAASAGVEQQRRILFEQNAVFLVR